MLAHRVRALVFFVAIALCLAAKSDRSFAQAEETAPAAEQGTPAEAPQSDAGAGLGNGGGSLGEPETPSGTEAEPETEAAPDPEAEPAIKPDAAAAEEAAATAAATSTTEEPDADLRRTVERVGSAGSGSAGNLTYDVAIDVPGFRGLEPSIALSYNSLRKTKIVGLYQGWLGYGWGLDGFDVIERASPGYGIPAFGAANSPPDIFLLNGEALLACGAGVSSPSCAAGGTHATENESYRRIAFVSASNEWRVSDRDGTLSTFRSVAAIAGINPAAGTAEYDVGRNYRWLLTSVTDTHGNSVSYGYGCGEMVASPLTGTCYPNTISYNGTLITFHRQTRPDLILMANGRDISAIRQRIRTISVKVGGVLRSAYSLSYDQAPFSNASRLTLVELYGTDATVAADGTVTPPATGPIKKRIASFGYQDAGASYTLVPSVLPRLAPTYNTTAKSVDGMNLNGKDELHGEVESGTWHEGRDHEDGYWDEEIRTTRKRVVFNADNTVTVASADGIKGVQFVGRFDGSRNFRDLVANNLASRLVEQTWGVPLACSAAPAVYQAACSALPTGSFDFRRRVVIDPDGNGTDSLFSFDPNNHPFEDADLMGIVDLRGNGRQELLFSDDDASNSVYKSQLVSGVWDKTSMSSIIDCEGSVWCAVADVNGDGATDAIQFRHSNDQNSVDIYLSTGRSLKLHGSAALPAPIPSAACSPIMTMTERTIS